MTTQTNPSTKWRNVARWTARIVSVPVIVFAIGEFFPGEETIASATGLFWYDYMNLTVLYLSVAGLLLGWWRPMLGGWIAIGGGLLLTLVLIPVFEQMLTWGFLAFLVLPGALFVASVWKTAKPAEAASG
jgi:hypothetical protein